MVLHYLYGKDRGPVSIAVGMALPHYGITPEGVLVMLKRLIDWLIGMAKQRPHKHLDGYMNRYFLIPETRFGAVRIHEILTSDDDRAYHDHPFWFISIILKGSYFEWRPVYEDGVFKFHKGVKRDAGSVAFRRASEWHRLELFDDFDGRPEPVWTLFICGQRKRVWGFLNTPKFKTKWDEYRHE